MHKTYQVGVFELVKALIYAVNCGHFVVHGVFVRNVVTIIVTQKARRKLVFFRAYTNRNVRILKNPFVDLLGVVTHNKNLCVHFAFTSV